MYRNKWETSTPKSRGVYLGLDSTASGGIEICTDMNQYIDFTTMSNDYRGRINYNTTNNDFKMYVNGKCNTIINIKQHNIKNEQYYGDRSHFQCIINNRNIGSTSNSNYSRLFYRSNYYWLYSNGTM